MMAMLTLLTRQHLQGTFEFCSRLRFGTVVENLDNISHLLALSDKIEGNNDYHDVTDQDIDLTAVREAILSIYGNDNVRCMLLKNDAKNRIAFVFDTIPCDPESFERIFNLALSEKGISFSIGWMEDWQDLVYILQL